jgi:hypothetical protein
MALKQAEDAASVAINDIAIEWEIDKYPNFLRSVGTSMADWDLLVQKFQRKILQAAEADVDPDHKEGSFQNNNFTISFMGSSVTAGHDSSFKESFPVLVGEKMSPLLAKLGVHLTSRNVAMGNNPCMPYDVCVETFAGKDVDVVHWEQTYNCAHGDNQRILEQFFRQSISLPNRPLIVFTDSDTPNWRKKDCPRNLTGHLIPLPEITPEEIEYLRVYSNSPSGISDIATNTKLNTQSIFRRFGYLNHIMKKYKSVTGVQLWDHSLYHRYKCHGPYLSDWQQHNAKWHPSGHGHKLRADHHVFFWLAAWRDAIISLRRDHESVSREEFLETLQHINDAAILPPPLIASNISDHIQCFTNYEPRSERNNSLHSLVVAGRARVDLNIDLSSSSRHKDKGSSGNNIGWKTEIYEALASKKIITMANKAGYLDYKVVMYGNEAAGPLSLLLTTKQADANVFLCEAPGIWGKVMSGFAPLHDAGLELYITQDVGQPLFEFDFQYEKAFQVEYSRTKVDDLCIQVMHKLAVGQHHVLTIVPRGYKKVTLATILVP